LVVSSGGEISSRGCVGVVLDVLSLLLHLIEKVEKVIHSSVVLRSASELSQKLLELVEESILLVARDHGGVLEVIRELVGRSLSRLVLKVVL